MLLAIRRASSFVSTWTIGKASLVSRPASADCLSGDLLSHVARKASAIHGLAARQKRASALLSLWRPTCAASRPLLPLPAPVTVLCKTGEMRELTKSLC